MKRISLPLTDETIESLRAGDSVLISGDLLTGRDAAHKRFSQLLEQGKPLPVDLKGQVIYYVGPAPAKPGYPVGPAGPTSSYRMDAYTPALLDLGMKGMIGKGARSPEILDAIQRNHAVYFAAIGGAAALIAPQHQGRIPFVLRGSGHRSGAPLSGRGFSRYCCSGLPWGKPL